MSSRSTLFVSNLPYTATSTDLKTLFSDIAPVRSAFVVLEHGTGTSKGVGYVSFAIPEDAKATFDGISTDGITLDGRKLRIEWAANKVFVVLRLFENCCRIFTLAKSGRKRQQNICFVPFQRCRRRHPATQASHTQPFTGPSCHSYTRCLWPSLRGLKGPVEEISQVSGC
jgi:RNA recognition motif-containing protein